jgi:cytochrome c5
MESAVGTGAASALRGVAEDAIEGAAAESGDAAGVSAAFTGVCSLCGIAEEAGPTLTGAADGWAAQTASGSAAGREGETTEERPVT